MHIRTVVGTSKFCNLACMKKAADNQYTHAHIVSDDGSVSFQCSSDKKIWPWLELDPFDPIVVQTINFWASVETGAARGTLDATKWSALTQTEWTCGEPGTGHATHGIAEVVGDGDSPRYGIRFFDHEGALVYDISGTGVVFKTRNFESWRKQTRKKTTAPLAPEEFEYADALSVGVTMQSESFLSPLVDSENTLAHGLITKENGFMPAHRYISGSGDHVNATHLAVVGRQFAYLLLGSDPLVFPKGEMAFTRYVELGRPFDIELVEHRQSQKEITLNVRQADRKCAHLKLVYANKT